MTKFSGTSFHTLRPATPVRSWLVVGALGALGAAGLIIGLVIDSLLPLLIAGGVLLFAALVLALVTASFMATRTLQVTLDDDGYQISGPGYRREGQWREVNEVRATPDGFRLVIVSGPVRRDFIQAPSGVGVDEMTALTEEIAERLRRIKG